MLADEDRLREERRKANPGGMNQYGNQFANQFGNPYANQFQDYAAPPSPVSYQAPPPPSNDIDSDLQRALAESRRTHAEEARKRNGPPVETHYEE